MFIDVAEKELAYSLGGLRLIDGVVVTCYGSVLFKIRDPQRCYVNLLATTDLLTLTDIWEKLKLETQNVMAPTFFQYRAEDLYGNPQVRTVCQNTIKMEVGNNFQKWGLELIQLTANYIFPEDWIDHYRGGLPAA